MQQSDHNDDPRVVVEDDTRGFYRQLIHCNGESTSAIDAVEEALDESRYLSEFENWLTTHEEVSPAIAQAIESYSRTHLEVV